MYDEGMNAQEIQNQIYRKMTAKKKLEITVNFYRTGKFLNNLNAKTSRTRKSSKNRQNS